MLMFLFAIAVVCVWLFVISLYDWVILGIMFYLKFDISWLFCMSCKDCDDV